MIEEFDPNMVSTSIQSLASADKVHLVNLIGTLKSELATTNELLSIKNAECKDVVVRLRRGDDELLAAQSRIQILENKTVRFDELVVIVRNDLMNFRFSRRTSNHIQKSSRRKCNLLISEKYEPFCNI